MDEESALVLEGPADAFAYLNVCGSVRRFGADSVLIRCGFRVRFRAKLFGPIRCKLFLSMSLPPNISSYDIMQNFTIMRCGGGKCQGTFDDVYVEYVGECVSVGPSPPYHRVDFMTIAAPMRQVGGLWRFCGFPADYAADCYWVSIAPIRLDRVLRADASFDPAAIPIG